MGRAALRGAAVGGRGLTRAARARRRAPAPAVAGAPLPGRAEAGQPEIFPGMLSMQTDLPAAGLYWQ